jgi:hypothetical protein
MKFLNLNSGLAFFLSTVIILFAGLSPSKAGEAQAAIAFSRETGSGPEWKDAWTVTSLAEFKDASAIVKSQEQGIALFFATRTNLALEPFQYFVKEFYPAQELILPANVQSNRVEISNAQEIYLLLFEPEDFRKSALKPLLEAMAKTPKSLEVRASQYKKLQQELDQLRSSRVENTPKRTRVPVVAGVFRTPPSDDRFKWQDASFKLQFSMGAPAVLHWSRATLARVPTPADGSKADSKPAP